MRSFDINASQTIEPESDLVGRTALVTGGRVLIGFAVSLRLLRAGVHVEMTTRFPCDAAQRFGAQPDFASWADRLRIHTLDFRDLSAVEQFARHLSAETSLDILINNAAQTVRRPPAYYAHLLAIERAGADALPEHLARCVSRLNFHDRPPIELTQLPALADDVMNDPLLFPPGEFDATGRQLDLRPTNSWTLRVEDVSTTELVEAHTINAMAPFVLTKHLLPAIRRSRFERRFIVNVSAVEGRFRVRRKPPEHPHTNMAKAALNMFTLSVAEPLAREGIFVNAVDPGWVSRQEPIPDSQEVLVTPEEAAVRVLAPIEESVNGLWKPPVGLFFKDCKAVEW